MSKEDIDVKSVTQNTRELATVQWESLSFNDRKFALGEQWAIFGRRTAVDMWHLGRGLRSIRNEMRHGEFRPFLAEIGMGRTMAQECMALFDGYQMTALRSFATKDAALRALPPKRAKGESAEKSALADSSGHENKDLQGVGAEKSAPGPGVTTFVPAEPDRETALDEAEAKAEREAAERAEAEREASDERFAIITQEYPGDVIEGWRAQYASDQAALRKAAELHRADVQAVKDGLKRERRAERKCKDICDALLAATPSTLQAVHDDVLARFFGVRRKGGMAA